MDFVILLDRKPFVAIEVKSQDEPLAAGLAQFLNLVSNPPAIQISLYGKKDYETKLSNGAKVRFMPASGFLRGLP